MSSTDSTTSTTPVVTLEEIAALSAARTALQNIRARNHGADVAGIADVAGNLLFTVLNYAASYHGMTIPKWQMHNRLDFACAVRLEQHDGETPAVAAGRIADELEAAGFELLEAHGELVTLPGYAEGLWPLVDAMLTELERRIVAAGSIAPASLRVAPAAE